MNKCERLLWLVVVSVMISACTEKRIKVAGGGQAKGKIIIVEEKNQAGQYVAMGVDSRDKVHMVYFDKQNQALKYAVEAEDGFSKEFVDKSCKRCLYGAIAVDKDANAHLAYYSDASKTLVYAYKKDGEWQKEPIEWGDGIGMGARLLFDHEGKLHVLYYSRDGYLKHAWKLYPEAISKDGKKISGSEKTIETKDTFWKSERIDKANGSDRVQISFKRQPKDRLAASYFHWSGFDSDLRVAIEGLYDTWTIETVAIEQNPGKSSSLFFTPKGEPRVIFREARKDRLSFAEPTKDGWESKALVENAYNMALASNDKGEILVAYLKMPGTDPRKGKLCSLLYKNGKWTRFDVDAEDGSGTYLDAALTKSAKPLIAYYEDHSQSLKLFVGQ